MASREREEKGSRKGATRNQTEPKGSNLGMKLVPQGNQKRSQTVAKMKKAPLKPYFAEQERNSLENECEKDDNVCQKGAKMDPQSMPKDIKHLEKQVTNKLTKVIENIDKTMSEWSQKS